MRSGVILTPLLLLIAIPASGDGDPTERARAVMHAALVEHAPEAPKRPEIPVHPLEEKGVPAPNDRGAPATPPLEGAALELARTRAFQLLFGVGSLGPPLELIPMARPGQLPVDPGEVADRRTNQQRTEAARVPRDLPVPPPAGGR
jgi:hypothetical protein